MYMAVVHHSESPDVSAATIDGWHQDRQFEPRGSNSLRYIGYHWVVHPDGSVEAGRSLDVQGTHCPDYNLVGVMAICLTGSDTEPWYPTDQQYRATAALINAQGIPSDKVYFHRDLYSTSCPGRLNKSRLVSYLAPVPQGDDDMARFVELKNDEDGIVYGCARVTQFNTLNIHCEAPGHDHALYLYAVPYQGDIQPKQVMVGGWENRDKVYGGLFQLGELFPGMNEYHLTIHSKVPLAIELY